MKKLYRLGKIEFERGKLPQGIFLIEFKGEDVFREKVVVNKKLNIDRYILMFAGINRL